MSPGQVVRQLKEALQPCVHDVQLDWGGAGAEHCQAPALVPPLYDGSRLLVFRLWGPGTSLGDTVTITAHTPEGELAESVQLGAEAWVEGELLHRMFARKMIQDLEERSPGLDSEAEVSAVITDLGLKYSLASRHTSFIGVSQGAGEGEGVMVSRQVHNQLPDRMQRDGGYYGASRQMMRNRAPMMNMMNYPPPGAAPPGAAAPGSRNLTKGFRSVESGPPPGCPAPASAARGGDLDMDMEEATSSIFNRPGFGSVAGRLANVDMEAATSSSEEEEGCESDSADSYHIREAGVKVDYRLLFCIYQYA